LKISFKFKYIKKVNLTVCLFLLCSGLTAQVAWEFNSQQIKEYNDIIAGKCNREIINTKDSPNSTYLANLKQSIDLLIFGNESDIENYEDDFESQIEIIVGFKDLSPYRNYYLADMRLRTAFIYIKFGRHIDAGWQFRQAYKAIKKNIQQYPDFKAHYKTMGLMNILLGSVPEKYKWIISLAGMEGSIKEGVDQLEKTILEDSIHKNESLIILSLLNAYIINDVTAASSRMQNLKINGELITLAAMSIYLKASQSQQVIRQFEKYKKEITCITPIYYLVAESYLQKGEYDMATILFNKFINEYTGQSNIKDAYYKLYICEYLLNNDLMADQYLQKAKSINSELTEADKYAGKMIRNEEFHNKEILKIRLATDGGFYNKASELISLDPETGNKKDSVEFVYRKARLMHKNNNVSEASTLYETVINISRSENWYFAPNSALMLGYIYFEKGDLLKSRKYLLQSIKYKHHEYENSIETKAEALLNTIKDRLND
jgi:tetratricopeptide (TPR) repeat protein